LHEIDLELGGNFMGVSDFSEGDQKQIIRQNLIEESIASSRLEGANSSREVARKMLNEGRKPRTKDEQMIVNNHRVMQRIEQELKHEPLSLELLIKTLLQIHSKISLLKET
jgi:Fic family protein